MIKGCLIFTLVALVLPSPHPETRIIIQLHEGAAPEAGAGGSEADSGSDYWNGYKGYSRFKIGIFSYAVMSQRQVILSIL